jgi:hypothetical protein
MNLCKTIMRVYQSKIHDQDYANSNALHQLIHVKRRCTTQFLLLFLGVLKNILGKLN